MLKNILLFLAVAALCHGAVTYRVKLSAGEGGGIISISSEEYVAGVLAGEASVFRSDESLKAMAVAVRSYAANVGSRHRDEGYDFCSTTHCQRFDFHGITSRFRNISAATAGELLWYEGKPAFAVYSRDCGGVTEAARDIWPELHAPYLTTKRDPYCTRNRAGQWSWKADPNEIANALATSRLRCPGQLSRITIADRTNSGRARTLMLEGAGNAIPLSEASFRFAIGRALGWNLLRSDLYAVEVDESKIIFRGTGQGHGVGLCQDGAEEMGREGLTYRQILSFYYPGTTVARTGAGLHWTALGGEYVTLHTTTPERDGKLLAIAERIRHDAKGRIRLASLAGIDIYVYPDLASFRNATGEPGWVAASSTKNRIDMQPASILERKGVLEQTLRHEMLHVLIESAATPGLPLWFREGLVTWLANPAPERLGDATDNSDDDLRQRADYGVARRANEHAAERVAYLVVRYGEETVLSWVKGGLPAAVTKASANSEATSSK